MANDVPRRFVSVRFSKTGRAWTLPLDTPGSGDPPAPGESVVVSTDQGPAVAVVTSLASAVCERRLPPAESPERIVRQITRDDLLARTRQRGREEEAFRIGAMKIRERGLPMKLTRVEAMLDGSRVIFYFTAEGRIDFRELVRDLAARFRTRIEMRQIGVRDEARMLGGYAACGRPLCCTTWLQGFAPVSIKMAKQQGVSLNPSKLSGQCGRLKCCLRYELPEGKGVVHEGAHGESRAVGTGSCCGGGGAGGCGTAERGGACGCSA
jgi:cell fate regulator YaaT (PSP1 superfamily)